MTDTDLNLLAAGARAHKVSRRHFMQIAIGAGLSIPAATKLWTTKVEAATPKTFEHYTRHLAGSSFGTKFEGLQVSRDLPQQISGLFHAGSVGIIMSGWLGAVNYGVIVSNDVDKLLTPSSVSSSP